MAILDLLHVLVRTVEYWDLHVKDLHVPVHVVLVQSM